MSDWSKTIQILLAMEAANRNPQCPRCHGKGVYLMSRAMHRSEGMVPCNYENETGICGRNGEWILKPKKRRRKRAA